MSTLNREAYENLIDENIAWLKTMPRSLEQEHIRLCLLWCRENRHDIDLVTKERDDARAQNLAWIRWANGNDYPHLAMNDHTTAGIAILDEFQTRLEAERERADDWEKSCAVHAVRLSELEAENAALREELRYHKIPIPRHVDEKSPTA